MKTEIKIARLQKKIADLNDELLILEHNWVDEQLGSTDYTQMVGGGGGTGPCAEEIKPDSSEEYMEAAQPVAPAFRAGVKSGIEVGGQSEIVATEDIGGSDEIVDHEVTRGVQY